MFLGFLFCFVFVFLVCFLFLFFCFFCNLFAGVGVGGRRRSVLWGFLLLFLWGGRGGGVVFVSHFYYCLTKAIVFVFKRLPKFHAKAHAQSLFNLKEIKVRK